MSSKKGKGTYTKVSASKSKKKSSASKTQTVKKPKITRLPKHKEFYYKIESTRKQGSGRQQKVSIYGIKYGKLTFLTSTTWNTAGYKGNESEVLGALIRAKILPKSIGGNRSNYYSWSVGEKGNFKIVGM